VHPLLQWESKNITQPDCVFLALDVQHAVRMRHIVICMVPDSSVFYHIIS